MLFIYADDYLFQYTLMLIYSHLKINFSNMICDIMLICND